MTSSSKSPVPSRNDKCGSCNRASFTKSDGGGILCDGCNQWFHRLKCSTLTDRQFTALQSLKKSTPVVSSVHWFCPCCSARPDPGVPNTTTGQRSVVDYAPMLAENSAKIDSLAVSLSAVKSDIFSAFESLKDRLASTTIPCAPLFPVSEFPPLMPTVGASPVQRSPVPLLSTPMAAPRVRTPFDPSNPATDVELIDIHRRRLNVVVSGIPESVDGASDSDPNIVKAMFHFLNLDFSISECELYRIGPPQSGKTRLLKLRLPNAGLRSSLLNCCHLLKSNNDFATVYVNPDLTKSQQVIHKQILANRYLRKRGTRPLHDFLPVQNLSSSVESQPEPVSAPLSETPTSSQYVCQSPLQTMSPPDAFVYQSQSTPPSPGN